VDDNGGGRYGHSATKLADGRVLILGRGRDMPQDTPLATIFDPTSETFGAQPTTDAALDRMWSSAVPLDDGRVLVAGGVGQVRSDGARTVIYDPRTDALTYPLSPVFSDPFNGATALLDGEVLLVRAEPGNSSSVVVLYDPATDTADIVTKIAGGFPWRPNPKPVTLSDGRVLITVTAPEAAASDPSDEDGPKPTQLVHVFDPETREVALLTSIGSTLLPAITALDDGSALFIGGEDGGGNPLDQILRIP